MYLQSMFWIKNKENRNTHVSPSFTILKWGVRGYTLHGYVDVDMPSKTKQETDGNLLNGMSAICWFSDTVTLSSFGIN